MSAYFYLVLQICNPPYCSDTTISLCISNVGVVRTSITMSPWHEGTWRLSLRCTRCCPGRQTATNPCKTSQAEAQNEKQKIYFSTPSPFFPALKEAMGSRIRWADTDALHWSWTVELGMPAQNRSHLLLTSTQKHGNFTFYYDLSQILAWNWQKGADLSLTKGQRLKSPCQATSGKV